MHRPRKTGYGDQVAHRCGRVEEVLGFEGSAVHGGGGRLDGMRLAGGRPTSTPIKGKIHTVALPAELLTEGGPVVYSYTRCH